MVSREIMSILVVFRILLVGLILPLRCNAYSSFKPLPRSSPTNFGVQRWRASSGASSSSVCIGRYNMITSLGRPCNMPRRMYTSPLASSSRDLSGRQRDPELTGEESAAFSVGDQRFESWVTFVVILTSVLTALYYFWINPDTGYGLLPTIEDTLMTTCDDSHLEYHEDRSREEYEYAIEALLVTCAASSGDDFIHVLEDLTGGDTTLTIASILGIFAACHSGLASLRLQGEELIGARAWRVLFGVVSLPLAISAVVYFINHRYDGVQLWDIKMIPGVHSACWVTSFVSFLFLYPSTFNLLEVAAVDKPQLHLWETGIIRITRHPQTIGQGLWCAAHLAWVGTSFTAMTSAVLMAHHIFSVWNGDRRLRERYGEEFETIEERTSVFPFKAVWEGRQQLPNDYWREFARVPYVVVFGGTFGAYLAHPFLEAGSWILQW